MKNILAVVIVSVSLSGCGTLDTVRDWWPSSWDPNQSKVITDLRQQTRQFDCKKPHTEQIVEIRRSVEWFQMYSESKKTKDVLKLTGVLGDTVKEFDDRVNKGPVSNLYCELKKKVMIQQTDIIAETVQGRW